MAGEHNAVLPRIKTVADMVDAFRNEEQCRRLLDALAVDITDLQRCDFRGSGKNPVRSLPLVNVAQVDDQFVRPAALQPKFSVPSAAGFRCQNG